MRIRVKKRTIALLISFLLISVFILMIADSRNVSAQCSGTDLYTLRIKDPNNVLIKSSPQQTISPTGGTDCNTIDNDNVTINGTYCQVAGTYKANITCDSCSVHTAVTDTVVLTCSAPETNKFLIRNSSGGTIAAFDEKGYVYLRGNNYTSVSSMSPPPNSWIIKNSNNAVMAYINSTGDLHLNGGITLNQGSSLNPGASSFVVKNSTGNSVAYINRDGSLFLSGKIYHNWTDTI